MGVLRDVKNELSLTPQEVSDVLLWGLVLVRFEVEFLMIQEKERESYRISEKDEWFSQIWPFEWLGRPIAITWTSLPALSLVDEKNLQESGSFIETKEKMGLDRILYSWDPHDR